MIERNNTDTIIQFSNYRDLKAIAKVHRSAFPDHLSTALGIQFVRKTLSWYLENKRHGFLMHVEENGAILGYVTGFYNDGQLKHGSATTIGQYAFKTAIFSFMLRPWLLFHPEIRHKWRLVLKQFSLKFGITHPKTTIVKPENKHVTNPTAKMCSLLSIGVEPESQGKGVGSMLIKAFEKAAFEKFHVRRAELSVRSDNWKAKQSYLRNGWTVMQENNGNCVMQKSLVNE